jgi:hypothetical protein
MSSNGEAHERPQGPGLNQLDLGVIEATRRCWAQAAARLGRGTSMNDGNGAGAVALGGAAEVPVSVKSADVQVR